MKNDKELRLMCACAEPFHFVHFCYDIDENDLLNYFQIEFQVYEGSIWKRIKKAIEIIFSGWVNGTPEWTCIERERIRELRDFCNQCLESTKDWNSQ